MPKATQRPHSPAMHQPHARPHLAEVFWACRVLGCAPHKFQQPQMSLPATGQQSRLQAPDKLRAAEAAARQEGVAR